MSVKPVKPKQVAKKPLRKRLLRWLFKATLLLILLCLTYIIVGQILCEIAAGKIAELTHTRIITDLIDFNYNGSVVIDKLVIKPYQKQQYDSAIMEAETVRLRFALSSLLMLRPRIKEIDVNDFVFNAQHDTDTERWNLETLKILPPNGDSGKMPIIRLQNGRLQYSKVSNGQARIAAQMPIDATFGHKLQLLEQSGADKLLAAEDLPEGYSFSIATADISKGLGQSNLTGTFRPGMITLAGGISSTDIPAFEKAWSIYILAAALNYDKDNNYSLKLRVRDMSTKDTSTDELLALEKPYFMENFGAFAALQKFFTRYKARGRIDIDLDAKGSLDRLTKSKIDGKIFCHDATINNQKFPYLINNVGGLINFTENTISFDNLQGRHKDVELNISGSLKDFGRNLMSKLHVTSGNMIFDDDLLDALKPGQRRAVNSFSPKGNIAIDYTFTKDPQTGKSSTLDVELLDIEAEYAKFPYPLNNLTGRLSFDNDNVSFNNLLSKTDNRNIAINGQITAMNTGKPNYDLVIDVNNIPLDSTLAEAMGPDERKLYDRFVISGFTDGQVKVFSKDKDSARATFEADLNFGNTSLKVDKPPMTLSDVSAKALLTSDKILIKELTGRYAQDSMAITGRIWNNKQTKQPGYDISVHTKNTPIGDSLFNLLPEEFAKNEISYIRSCVAKHPKSSSKMLIVLFEHEKSLNTPAVSVIKALYNNKKLPYIAKVIIENLFGDML